MLYGGCRERLAELAQEVFADCAIVASHADLDQLVALEIDVDLLQHSGAQPLVADAHDRFEQMGARFEFAAAGRGKVQVSPMRSAWIVRSF